jgi:NAD(P)H dehydrogenase (quinone)
MPTIYSVYAHPNRTSTTHSINQVAEQIGKKKGYIVETNDLYRNAFNPVLSTKDMKAFREGKMDNELQEEQEILKNSDLILLSYPIWWAGMPAIMKGWIDRVFSYGFAYKVREGQPLPLLTNKKAIIINTHGQPRSDYEKNGMFNAMNIVTDIGIFDFCGIEVLEHLYYEEGIMNTDQRNKLFDEIESDLELAIPERSFFE